jgi:hypothetical protein
MDKKEPRMVRAVVVGQEEVSQLAKDLISKGEKPTIGRIRELLGNRGSPNTISRYLKTWREGEIEHIRHGEHDLFAAESDSESHAKSDDDVAKKKVTYVSADAVSPVLNSDANISRQPVKKAAPAAPRAGRTPGPRSLPAPVGSRRPAAASCL